MIGIWPASILTARLAVRNHDLLQNKIVLELGAGCGVPALAAALYCDPNTVYISDINDNALKNALYNAKLNQINKCDVINAIDAVDIGSIQLEMKNSPECVNNNSNDEYITLKSINTESRVKIIKLNWFDQSTFPKEPIDVILGSDLVYDHKILSALTFAVSTLLIDNGSFLYIAPDENRDGMTDLINAMSIGNIYLHDHQPCPPE